MKEDRRRHDRVVVPEDKLLDCEGVSRALQGKISVLGLGGMYIRTADVYPVGTELELRIRSGAETVETPCVVRDVIPGGLGVEFTWVRGSLEQKLQKLMVQIKP
ncbi:MAG TPA: PilZ domain-containing protein [Candidatus Acidoferrales bacterium]|nr:PilZ domain-containing protein [Candidatus Acidoferrales bacterium]